MRFFCCRAYVTSNSSKTDIARNKTLDSCVQREQAPALRYCLQEP